MQLHELKPNRVKKARKRVGRGGKKGTYAGRGLNGQKSRSGRKTRVGFAGGDTTMIKRLPKQRGTVGGTDIRKGVKLSRYKINQVVLNMDDLNKVFDEGEVVSPKSLLEKKLIYRTKNRIPKVKILGRSTESAGKGKLDKKLLFRGVSLSASVSTQAGIVLKNKTERSKMKSDQNKK